VDKERSEHTSKLVSESQRGSEAVVMLPSSEEISQVGREARQTHREGVCEALLAPRIHTGPLSPPR
jgi:hypothetical protein